MRLLTFAALSLILSAQTPRRFDEVSVRPSAPDEHNSFFFQNLPGGTVRMLGVPLRMVLMQAFDAKVFQIAGGPEWIRIDRWDIVAKAEGISGRLPRPEENEMLRGMMAERFQLKTHIDTKEMQTFELVSEKSGSKLAVSSSSEPQFRTGSGSLIVKKGGTLALSSWLSRQLWRVVIDKTGLNGEYDYQLTWTPDPGDGGPESIGQSAHTNFGAVPDWNDGSSIFTASKQQLGLRLISQKGPVEMIVIDSVNKPSAN